MTFYEAAIEVLRRSGRPLHFKKITEIAIRDGLLDHVGKTPDVTMSARLNQEVKREEQAAILRTRPGIFALRDEVAKKLNEEAAAREAEQAAASEEEAKRQADEAAKVAADSARKEAARAEALAEAHRLLAEQQAKPAAPARQAAAPVAAPAAVAEGTLEEDSEEDEDGDDQGAEGNNGEGGEGGRRRRRRRRGRRGRGGEANGAEEREDSAPAAVAAPVVAPVAPVAPAVVAEVAPVAAVAVDAVAPIVRNGREERGERGDRRDRNGRRDRDRDRNGRRDEQAPREEQAVTPREERNGRAAEAVVAAPVAAAPVAAPRAEASSAPAPKLDGFAQAAYTVLRERRAPMTLSALSEAITERRLVRFHTHDAVGTLRAALVNDNHLRAQRRARPLFASYEQGRWGLTDWGLTDANLRREQQITALAEECEQDTLRALGEALVGVSNEALEQLAVQLLDRMGYRNVKVSKRSAEGDVFFTADVRQGFRETRVCVQMTGHREPLAQGAVVELRGTLHHYAASEGVILHLGEVTREAVDESREARLAPIAVLDRAQLAKTLLTHEIGVKRVYAPILLVDTAFVDALKGA